VRVEGGHWEFVGGEIEGFVEWRKESWMGGLVGVSEFCIGVSDTLATVVGVE